jgi:RHH-type transcriptional regulator, proline utilization regulon repressor / proline dehydrogenase / delta 1-pyrroline-5-carboxylate dehydrogenase
MKTTAQLSTVNSPLNSADTQKLWQAVSASYRADETAMVEHILAQSHMSPDQTLRTATRAVDLVERTRKLGLPSTSIEAFLAQYQLTSLEGIALMCLAEALLRTPDAQTLDRLIADKISVADWRGHMGKSPSMFVNASSWALMLTRSVLVEPAVEEAQLWSALKRLAGRMGAPVVRTCALQAIKLLGSQFVMGQTIGDALSRANGPEKEGWTFSYDMLGEAARTRAQADAYFISYQNAIAALGTVAKGRSVTAAPGISIKLSALHPRFEMAQRHVCVPALTASCLTLAEQAAAAGIGLTLDAEETDRLELSLEILEQLAFAPSLQGWNGLGLAVQAYQKRAPDVINWLADLAARSNRRLMVRLVKGAYWDSEIKRAQERGVSGYPVYTRKVATDVSYLACAKTMLANPDCFYPQFATHNAHTLAAITTLAGNNGDYEFQRLHGMGETLYQAHWQDAAHKHCRVYAPVGAYEDLLPYLVRRLLENGANTSFVNHLHDANSDAAALVADPITKLKALPMKPHPNIPQPLDIFGARKNAIGVDLSDRVRTAALEAAAQAALAKSDRAAKPTIMTGASGTAHSIYAAADSTRLLGTATFAERADIDAMMAAAVKAQPDWEHTSAATRAACLEATADVFETEIDALVGLISAEGGRTLPDAISEVREAIDFCRYYASEARRLFSASQILPGPTGEANSLHLTGRGVFVCISPWNFPLAIFVGQVVAALVAGNAVLAKPAEETPLIAARAVEILHSCGVPKDILALVPGDGTVGAALVAHKNVAGVCFTGSTAVAKIIQRALAAKDGAIVPLIAETGGINAMIVDSTALLEQVVGDVLLSSFNSAGQRCSALRLLFIQADVADHFITMLNGALAEINVGDPAKLASDIGPVISRDAYAMLTAYQQKISATAKLVAQAKLPENLSGNYISPQAYELNAAADLTDEIFGPILHIVRWQANDLDSVIDHINNSGYGLTLGVHSRIDETVQHIRSRAKVGNIYVNRNMVGAVVGCQPFGGEGLSGTGPKAGGPNYLTRFASERCVSIDTTAVGGNASLLCADEG